MNQGSKKGFTIIELMLSMSFVSLLLMAIAVTTIQISNIYNKGITLREVNQAGRAISDDIGRTISQSEPFDVDTTSPTTRYIVKPGGGRLCTGRFTYAWNLGSAIRGGAGAPAIYNKYTAGTVQVRFVKVTDNGGSLCDNPASNIVKANATEQLNSGDRDLVVHLFTVTKGSEDLIIKQALYSVVITLGTNDSSQLLANDTSCRAPSAGSGDEDYCSVNQFTITTRAGNKVSTGY
ncbi:MAG: hypothetical protein ABIQ04_05115 [Candidatus Saccharimonadales bacterium]